MARERTESEEYAAPLKRLLLGVLGIFLLGVFLLWRIDSPRVERFRAEVIDRVVPGMDWVMTPVTGAINLVRDFQSYQRLAEQKKCVSKSQPQGGSPRRSNA